MRFRKFSSKRRSNTGWVTAYSAPACTLYSKRLISSSSSEQPGICAHSDYEAGPRANRIAAQINPAFRLWTMFTRPIASTSKTAVASG